jgi:integrase/recombinase XerD
MLHQVIRRAYYLNKHLEAPLLKEREEYLEYLADKGYYRETLKITAEYLLRITEFLRLEEERLITIEDIEMAAAAWARSKHHNPTKKTFSKSGGKKFVVLSIDWLKRINRLGDLPEDRIPLFNRLFERRHARKRHTSAPLLQ